MAYKHRHSKHSTYGKHSTRGGVGSGLFVGRGTGGHGMFIGRGGTQPVGSRGIFIGRRKPVGVNARQIPIAGIVLPVLAIGIGAFVIKKYVNKKKL